MFIKKTLKSKAVLFLFSISAIAIDQVFKFFVKNYLKNSEGFCIIPNFLYFTYVENTGIAFGMLKDLGWIFITVTSVFLTVAVFILIRAKIESNFLKISLALVIGGGVSNLIDRVFFGYVVDYFSFSFFAPVCNFADYFVTIGGICLLFCFLFCKEDLFGVRK
jgi:signal peptidase II